MDMDDYSNIAAEILVSAYYKEHDLCKKIEPEKVTNKVNHCSLWQSKTNLGAGAVELSCMQPMIQSPAHIVP